MTVPLIILAVLSITIAWGWPLHDAHASYLGHHIHHGQHHAVVADFGRSIHDSARQGPPGALHEFQTERHFADRYSLLAEGMAFGSAFLGFVFALVVYYLRRLDAEEARENFAGLHRFLVHKWYFDELYSVLVVRPALVIAQWCKAFDARIIDRFIDNLGRGTIWTAKENGRFDNGIVDGLVNLVARTTYSAGERLRHVQTGLLRNYVLFLVLAAVGIFVALSYLVAIAAAG